MIYNLLFIIYYFRRQIQEALNQQTYDQFRKYAEQQYPGNPEQVRQGREEGGWV